MICFELLISNYLRKNPSFAQAKLGFLDSLTSEKLNFSDVLTMIMPMPFDRHSSSYEDQYEDYSKVYTNI